MSGARQPIGGERAAVAAGQIDVGALITHEFTFDEFADAWATATDPGGDAIKVSLLY